jgi:two-component system chemotaxis sensor kinase CheA
LIIELDILVNLVGELVTVQARLTQTASLIQHADIGAIAEEVERLTGELRDNTLNIRMLPIGTTFGRFKRLVRDLSQELGKEIELTTEGEETELDKTVIERLNDPLVHLIRNCVDHGIELPQERVAHKKPAAGIIHLSASHSGAHVVIQIRDDGKGLDKEVLLAKAVEKGFIHGNTELTEKEIFNLIFLPGFSTAQSVTNVSGRGVGMDVVKRAMANLRGTIEITSEKGAGTLVTIKIPLTLAIVEGLLVAISDQCFVLPLSIVEECVELTEDDTRKSHNRNTAHIRGKLVPYIQLRKEFAVSGEPPAIQQIVVTGHNGDRIGFVVDSVIGEHQTVIKNLGKFYKDVEGISGATILGDGTVALIVDVPKLIDNAMRTEGRT